MSRSLRVLFVAHDAYRAGGTMFLLNMLRWVRAHTDLQFDVALPYEGEMVAEFAPICRTFVLDPLPRANAGWCERLQTLWHRAKAMRRSRSLTSVLDAGGYDLLYLNTITHGEQLARLGRPQLPVLTHVHELSWAIRRYAHGQEQRVLDLSDRVICVSDAVLDNLLHSFGDLSAKAIRVHGFVPVDVEPAGTAADRRRRLLDPLGIPMDAYVVGMCGHGDLRKGADLAVPLARLLPARVRGREVHIVWVGAEAAEYPHDVALQDAMHAEVATRIHFAGVTRVPADWLSIFDLHVLLSREDPFPLVVMEAAAHGVPTLAFRGAGGAAEFIRSDAGACTPYLDLPALAKAIEELLQDDERRHALGCVARTRVQQQHSPDVVVPQIVRIIEEVCAARSSQRPQRRGAPS